MSRDLRDLIAPDETVVLETRQHWFVVLRDCAVLLLALACSGLAIWYATSASWLDNRVGGWVVTALWIVLGALALVCIWRALGWFTERFYVTSTKVVYAHGILNRNLVTTPLVKIDELTLRRPLLGRMLGFGRLEVDNASGVSEPLAGLEYLPRPVHIYRLLSERSRNQRMLEGGAHRDEDNDGLVDRPARTAPAPAAAPAPTPEPAPEAAPQSEAAAAPEPEPEQPPAADAPPATDLD